MFEIVEARFLAQDVKLLRIKAPRVAGKHQAGQFVIVRVHGYGERIPLTVVEADAKSGEIAIIVQGIGKTTRLINSLEPGHALSDVVGPLGQASEIERFGRVVVIGGGVGTAIAYPTAVALKRAGNWVTSIVGARTKQLLILEDEMRAASDELFLMTDDGSEGEQGFVTQKLQLLLRQQRVDRVLAIGPIPMMSAVAETTRPQGIPTIVSLNPIMVDGTGMCGGCRVLVGGESKFACVDGPEFDAHQVDFQVLAQRNTLYCNQEHAASERFQADASRDLELVHQCRLEELERGATRG